MTENVSQRLDRLWSPEPTPSPVQMGPWRFELRGDEIADVSFDGSPVVRSVRAVARDRDWNTVPTSVLSFEPSDSGYRLELSFVGFGAEISATLDIAHRAGMLNINLTATSHADFLTNRLGLVVLHPPVLAGTPLTVGSENAEEVTAFPTDVSPHQPAFGIRSLSWSYDGVDTRVQFSGDTFEMEDQRNWTDASYKTYNRPLALPFPYPIGRGETIEQYVSLTANRVHERGPIESGDLIELVRTGQLVPEVTLGASTIPDAAMPVAGASLPAGVGAVLVELDTRTPSWRAALERAASEAGELPLDVRVVADDPSVVHDTIAVVAATGIRVKRLGVFSGTSHSTEPELWNALTTAGRALPGVVLIGGARSHFTELNREHGRLPDGIPELSFSITPQMHATERAQLVESIPMQAVVVRSAGVLAEGRPLHIGPITLRARFNAVATSGAEGQASAGLERGYGAELTVGATDERQKSPGLEAWTIASFAAIAAATDAAQVSSVSYFEASGPRGLVDSGQSFPVEQAISALSALAGGELLIPSTPAHSELWCVGSRRRNGSWHVLLTNIGPAPVTSDLLIEGERRSIEIAPYAVLFLSSSADSASGYPPEAEDIPTERKTTT